VTSYITPNHSKKLVKSYRIGFLIKKGTSKKLNVASSPRHSLVSARYFVVAILNRTASSIPNSFYKILLSNKICCIIS
jgi:hypothetical protein